MHDRLNSAQFIAPRVWVLTWPKLLSRLGSGTNRGILKLRRNGQKLDTELKAFGHCSCWGFPEGPTTLSQGARRPLPVPGPNHLWEGSFLLAPPSTPNGPSSCAEMLRSNTKSPGCVKWTSWRNWLPLLPAKQSPLFLIVPIQREDKKRQTCVFCAMF